MVEKVIEVHRLAAKLMDEQGLTDYGWRFELSTTKHRVGECNHTKKRIRYSIHCVKETPIEEIKDTILHEIAHALVGPGHGHNRVWQAIAIAVGARPERCTEMAETTAKPNYVLKCPNCGNKWQRYRLKKALHSARCPDCQVAVEIYKVR